MNANLKVGYTAPTPPTPKTQDEIMKNWQGDVANPKVSIICATFNHVKFIKHALNGFLMQETNFPFEIIVHDDASTDGTTDIIKDYAASYPQIIRPIIQSENQWNMGKRPLQLTYKYCKGEFICVCEGDDYWLDKNKVSKQLNALNSNKNFVIAYHHAVIVNEEGVVTGYSKASESSYTKEELKKSPFIPTLTRFYRKKDYTWLSQTPLPVAGDMVQTTFLSRFGGAKFVGDIMPSIYRQHEGGVWSKKSEIEQRRITIEASLFIAEMYNLESDSTGKVYFLNRVIAQIFKLTNRREALQIAKNVLKITLKKFRTHVRKKIKKLLGLY